MKGEANAHLIEDIPTGIYTIPEISSVGKTETAANRDESAI